jgi:radical SAM superfamily enzyme YgiQ (UPF0313 family)
MRVLIASAWKNEIRSYDVATWKKRRNLFSLSAPMEQHFGLRFLKANVPPISILEYPTRQQYLDELSKGWDVVGISFYINETNDAIEMANAARRAGVKAVWAGNYGSFTPSVQQHFDRTFDGWSEVPLAEAMGYDLGRGQLKHPLMFMNLYYRGVKLQTWGILFTSRGCNKSCTFCQTPKFYRSPYPLDLPAIEAVVREYRRLGVAQVVVLDENFGHFENFTSSGVVQLFRELGVRWNPLTRVETLYKNYDAWVSSGMVGASIGVESLNQGSLDAARKGNDAGQIRELLSAMNSDRMLTQVFYIIGFPEDTEQSIRDNIQELEHYNVDAPQIQILTPYPATKQYAQIERNYGIRETDLSKYDSTHLVWNHPRVSPDKMRELLSWANDTLYTNRTTFNTLKKIVVQNLVRFAGRRQGESLRRRSSPAGPARQPG